MNGQTKKRTWIEICRETCKDADNVGRQFRRIFPDRKWRKKDVPKPDEYTALISKDGQPEDNESRILSPVKSIPARTKKEASTQSINSTPANSIWVCRVKTVPPAKAFRWTMIGVCIAHSGLIANGLHTLSPHGEGLIAGGFVCAVIVGVLFAAHASELEGTSLGACWLATVVYIGAGFVHYQAFMKDSPDLNHAFVGFLAAFICLMATASIWLVRDSKLVKVIWH